MGSLSKRYGNWALVAGSAEGLGEAYSIALARQKLNLIMIDNSEKALNQLAATIENEFHVKVDPLAIDLSSPDSGEKIIEKVKQHNCRLMIYVAAFSIVKPFESHSIEELNKYIAVNCRTPLELTHSFYRQIKSSGGGILLMSSLSGLIGSSMVTPYNATKAFNTVLAESLHHEFSASGVDIMACIAGATATPAYLASKPKYGWIKPKVMDPGKVAEGAIKQLGKKSLYIPGFSNRVNYFFLTRFLPRRWSSWIVNRTVSGMYRDKRL
jgi:short-subunit dehydrogenase